MSFINKIPGYRTRTPWKMVVATLFYLILISSFFPHRIDPNLQTAQTTSPKATSSVNMADSPNIRGGQTAIVTRDIFLAKTEKDHDELLKFAVNKNHDAATQMLRSGRFFPVDANTKVTVVSMGDETCYLEVMEGENKGKKGYTAIAFLK